jgi:hypothetical protein
MTTVVTGRAPVAQAAMWTLMTLTAFCALAAVGGGILLLATNGLGMPHELLEGAPLPSFLVSGLFLLIAVGGTQASALLLLVSGRESRFFWSAAAGVGTVIWIIAQVGMIHQFDWPQAVCLACGVLQLVLVFALIGMVTWPPPKNRRPKTRA